MCLSGSSAVTQPKTGPITGHRKWMLVPGRKWQMEICSILMTLKLACALGAARLGMLQVQKLADPITGSLGIGAESQL